MTTQVLPSSHDSNSNSTGKTIKTTTSNSTLSQVNQVRSILLTRLPYELTDIILTQAQYFAHLSTKRTTHLRVETSNELYNKAKWIYMISEPVPEVIYGDDDDEGIRRQTKVQSVQFVVKSCDQGWGGASEDKNTYRNSNTWFETSIFRPSSPSTNESLLPLPPPEWLTSLSTEPINYNFSLSSPSSSLPSSPTSTSPTNPTYTELLSPYKNYTRPWLLQMNAQASRHIRSHTITWSRIPSSSSPSSSDNNDDNDGENKEESNNNVEYDDKLGNGRGLGFVETLKAGDRIAVIARALYPGWENNVYEVEVDITYQT